MNRRQVAQQELNFINTLQEKVIVKNAEEHFYFHATVNFSEMVSDFFNRNPDIDEFYVIRFNLDEEQIDSG